MYSLTPLRLTVLASFLFPLITLAQGPTLQSKLIGGGTSLIVQGTANQKVNVFLTDPGWPELDPATKKQKSCTDENVPADHRQALAMIVPGDSNAGTVQTSTDFKLSSSGNTVIPLAQPLIPGSTICLAYSGATPVFDALAHPVSDPNDYGRYRTYFILGVQASNQLSSASYSSSTAGQYFEAGFISAFKRAEGKLPGFTTNLDFRISPIPVAAQQTQVVSNGGSTPATSSSITPNLLTSQQSIRFVSSAFLPWRFTNWNNGDSFTVAPIVRGGFGTLLNPTASTSTPSSAGTPTTVTTSSYSSAYYFWGVGARLAWERYAPNRDKAARTFAQYAVTIGQYSNLPSFVCTPTMNAAVYSLYYPTGTTVTTACNQGVNAPTLTNGVFTSGYLYSRTIRPRIDMEGFAKLPNYPFILGFDANLQQYGLWGKQKLDYLNKPGNDIRIYIGITLDLNTLISKLGVPTS